MLNWLRRGVIANEVKRSSESPGLLRPFGPRNDNNDTEVTDPGIRMSADEYISPEAYTPIRWVKSLLENRRAAEETDALIAKVDRLATAPDNVVRYFFDNDLPALVSASRLKPEEVQKKLRTAFENTSNRQTAEPWFRLIQVAAGDASANLPALDSITPHLLETKSQAYLYALGTVATHRPLEATHLARQVFEKGNLTTRLLSFRTTLFSPHIGDGKMIGDQFVRLMAVAERKEIVEPFLTNMLQNSREEISPKSKGKLAWLGALYHGWQREALS
ncbi:MAG: hypothetical protein Q7T03_07830 [Deltaproteobacteria bacterium]|nr:hypothetical protein [Deltaproteobacteria bacterium]